MSCKTRCLDDLLQKIHLGTKPEKKHRSQKRKASKLLLLYHGSWWRWQAGGVEAGTDEEVGVDPSSFGEAATGGAELKQGN